MRRQLLHQDIEQRVSNMNFSRNDQTVLLTNETSLGS